MKDISKFFGRGGEPQRTERLKIILCLPDGFIEVELASGEYKTWPKDNVKLLN